MKTAEDYLVELQAVSDKDWERQGYNMERKPIYSLNYGKRWTKVVVETFGSKSVHCFIDSLTGDLYKSASWKAPAKGIRGNINNEKKPYLSREFYR